MMIDGNGCSIFTTSGKHAKTFQRQVNVGQIGINIPLIGISFSPKLCNSLLIFLAPYGTAVRTSNKDSFMGGEHINTFPLSKYHANIYGIDRHVPGKTYWPFFTTTKTVSARWDE